MKLQYIVYAILYNRHVHKMILYSVSTYFDSSYNLLLHCYVFILYLFVMTVIVYLFIVRSFSLKLYEHKIYLNILISDNDNELK